MIARLARFVAVWYLALSSLSSAMVLLVTTSMHPSTGIGSRCSRLNLSSLLCSCSSGWYSLYLGSRMLNHAWMFSTSWYWSSVVDLSYSGVMMLVIDSLVLVWLLCWCSSSWCQSVPVVCAVLDGGRCFLIVSIHHLVWHLV